MQTNINFSMRTKLFTGFGLIIVLLVFISSMSYLSVNEILKSQRSLYEKEFADALAMKDVRSEQNLIKANMLNMLLLSSADQRNAVHADIQSSVNKNNDLMQKLIGRNKNRDEQLTSLQQFEAIRNNFTKVREEQVIPLIHAGKADEAINLISNAQAVRMGKMESLADELVASADQNAQRALMYSENSGRKTLQILGIGSFIAVLLSLVMATWMVVSLRTVSRKIKEGVNVLATSASEITASTTQVAAGSAETAAAVNQTTTTIEEVKQTSEVSVQKAKNVADIAKKTVEISETGKQSMDDSIAAMLRIRDQMESIAESIVRLSEQSKDIGDIIATVNDLAEQSNLLAVNASIEAAKAGDQGKGFAVVAQEVKSMASQSKQATAQVRVILSEIQKAMSMAVLATEQGGKAVESGVVLSTQAGESIQLLAESISESAQAAVQIMSSSQQQLVGMDQVSMAMQNINQASAQNVASTKQAEAAAQDLHGLGQKLKSLTEQ